MDETEAPSSSRTQKYLSVRQAAFIGDRRANGEASTVQVGH